jgi:hypothetical protein
MILFPALRLHTAVPEAANRPMRASVNHAKGHPLRGIMEAWNLTPGAGRERDRDSNSYWAALQRRHGSTSSGVRWTNRSRGGSPNAPGTLSRATPRKTLVRSRQINTNEAPSKRRGVAPGGG